MKFKQINKVCQSKYITRYDIQYETNDGKIKNYEMISRDKNITTFEQLHNDFVDAVVLIMHNKNKDKILLNKEFRMAMGLWIYSFPAGLIDPGETPEQAGARELFEETGLHLDTIDDVLPINYSAMGFSNEKNICIVGTASGEFAPSTSSVEEIDARWYTKDEIKALLRTGVFSARAQSYCYLWCRM